jgi:Rad3-related DNA helicase
MPHDYVIGDFKVPFIDPPRPNQLRMAKLILEAITEKSNLVIEAATGSGKTQGYCAAAFAFYFSQEPKVRKPIIFVTRTIEQQNQIVDEIGRFIGLQDLKVVQLASRESLCINKSLTDQKLNHLQFTEACFSLGSACHPRMNTRPDYAKKLRGILGIDFVKSSCLKMTHAMCPHLVSNSASYNADFVVMTYARLVDRDFAYLELKDHVIVLDEGHTLEGTIETRMTLTVYLGSLIGDCEEELKLLRSRCTAGTISITRFFQTELNGMLEVIVECFGIQMNKRLKAHKDYRHKNQIVEIGLNTEEVLETLQCGMTNMTLINDLVVSLTDSLKEYHSLTGAKLQKLFDCLFLLNLFFVRDQEERDCYSYVIQKDLDGRHSFLALCVSPAGTIKRLFTSTKSVILTSGSLSPSSNLLLRLGTTFQRFESLDFPIQSTRFNVSVLSSASIHGEEVNFLGTQDNLKDSTVCELYVEGLACSIKALALETKGATLVFFPNYSRLEAVFGALNLIIKRDPLQVLSETRQSNTEQTFFEKISALSRSGPKLIILCVCRGKVAEGINLPKNLVKTLCMIGIPYANIGDIHIKKKNEYWSKNPLHTLSWLEYDAFCAVNQALGRLLRRSEDYGSFVFLESRYTREYFWQFLPDWLGIPETKNLDEICLNIQDIREKFTTS